MARKEDVPGGYAASWREYRRRRRWAVGLALGLGPLVAFWLLVEGRQRLESVALLLGLAWLGAAAVAGWRFGRWPCPRCRRPFAMSSLRDWALATPGTQVRMLATRRCWHCGLPKWAPKSGPAGPRPEQP
jgi:hypothetical protein